jgi:Lysylphosphatidylglycerol synthase TM region
VILGIGCLIHALTIPVVWSLGRAQGLVLPALETAILFTVMIGVGIVPVSIGGWGLRELAVISLLGNQGVSPEKALLFSVSFGLAPAVASLPGGLKPRNKDRSFVELHEQARMSRTVAAASRTTRRSPPPTEAALCIARRSVGSDQGFSAWP